MTQPFFSRPPIIGAHGRLSAVVKFECDEVTREQFAQLARSQGKSVSALGRELVEKAVGSMSSTLRYRPISLRTENSGLQVKTYVVKK